MATVYKQEDETIDELIKRFNKKVYKDNILFDYNNRRFYQSEGQRQRYKLTKAIRRRKREQQYENKPYNGYE